MFRVTQSQRLHSGDTSPRGGHPDPPHVCRETHALSTQYADMHTHKHTRCSIGGPPATRRDTAQDKGIARPTAVLLCWRREPLDGRASGRVLGPRCSNNQSTRTLTSDLTATNRCAGPVRGSTRDESCRIAAPALGAGPSAPSGPPQPAGWGGVTWGPR